MYTMGDLRRFLDENSEISNDAVLMAIENNPSDNFDNTGFIIENFSYSGRSEKDAGDLGVIYIHVDGLE